MVRGGPAAWLELAGGHRAAAGRGELPLQRRHEPAFLKGLLVQVLSAVLALLAARLLLAVVDQLRRLRRAGCWPDTDHARIGITAAQALADYERGPPGSAMSLLDR